MLQMFCFVQEALQAYCGKPRVKCGDCPNHIVQNPADILEDPQLKHRGHFQVIEHPEMGYHNYEMPPFQLSLTPAELTRPAPCLGQDNEYVCTDLLGIKDYDFIQFLHEGVFE